MQAGEEQGVAESGFGDLVAVGTGDPLDEAVDTQSKRDWGQIAKDLKPVCTAASESEALDRFAEFSGKWEKRSPAIIRLWENAWAEFVPFLRFDREIRIVICTTNAIESINARLRRAVNARGHFPTVMWNRRVSPVISDTRAAVSYKMSSIRLRRDLAVVPVCAARIARIGVG